MLNTDSPNRFGLGAAPPIGRTPNKALKILLFGGSLTAMAVIMNLLLGRELGAIVTCSIFIHELGHWLAFRYRGFTAGMLFLPPIGAAVYVDDKDRWAKASREEETFIAIAGPTLNAGLVLIGLIVAITHPSIGLKLALINASLCWFNLLPIRPFDGGHISNAIFVSADDRFDERIVRMIRFVGLLAWAAALFIGVIPLAGGLILWGSFRALNHDRYAYDHPRSMSNDVAMRWAWIWIGMLGVTVLMSVIIGTLANPFG